MIKKEETYHKPFGSTNTPEPRSTLENFLNIRRCLPIEFHSNCSNSPPKPIFAPIFTDGSYDPKSGKSGCGIFTGKERSAANKKWACKTIDTSLHAELEAVERAITIAPRGINITIFIDCMAAIDHAKRIKTLIEERVELNSTMIDFEWIPSHIKEKEKNRSTKSST
jgi:ribonuclease HI